jgi:hypothetical protein
MTLPTPPRADRSRFSPARWAPDALQGLLSIWIATGD